MKAQKIFVIACLSVIAANVLGNKLDQANAPSTPQQHTTTVVATPAAKSKKIKVALLLDTSNSMDGLIDQAKSQLWNIVNELAQAKAGNEAPELQIAIYQYGNSRLTVEKGWIRQETAFTSNLDIISEKLFALQTNGGDEYCGQVIQTALAELEWGSSNDDYKVAFIAGNEPFNQGSVTPYTALSKAKEKGIFVNAIYCGEAKEGKNIGWDNPSQQAAGAYLSIQSEEKTQYIATPQDQEIAALNQQLNETYVWYGSEGKVAYDNMNTQDNNAAAFGQQNMVNRALMKNGRFYNNRNATWDLVDKLNTEPGFKVTSLKAEDLPKEMQTMNPAERQNYVTQKQAQREAINQKIEELAQQRSQYLATGKGNVKEAASLENAMLATIRQQAGQKGFSFEEEQTAAQQTIEFVPALTDFDYFMEVAEEVRTYRKTHLVNFNTWLAMSKEPNTIILDTRSQAHYDAMHIEGAIHLDFAAFNVYDLARLIPNQETRILIYCNNNIDTDNADGFKGITNEALKQDIQRNLVSKVAAPPRLANAQVLKLPTSTYQGAEVDAKRSLALNIPTMINLFGYNYKNVYELNELVKPNDPRLKLEGKAIQ